MAWHLVVHLAHPLHNNNSNSSLPLLARLEYNNSNNNHHSSSSSKTNGGQWVGAMLHLNSRERGHPHSSRSSSSPGRRSMELLVLGLTSNSSSNSSHRSRGLSRWAEISNGRDCRDNPKVDPPLKPEEANGQDQLPLRMLNPDQVLHPVALNSNSSSKLGHDQRTLLTMLSRATVPRHNKPKARHLLRANRVNKTEQEGEEEEEGGDEGVGRGKAAGVMGKGRSPVKGRGRRPRAAGAGEPWSAQEGKERRGRMLRAEEGIVTEKRTGEWEGEGLAAERDRLRSSCRRRSPKGLESDDISTWERRVRDVE
mmetsp:Transcript_27770/g.45146  ORF Transcript_27770/g.45146 Transcript_27770/m.45146 type:complete len:310 (+) Transcript_27770:565-1494(+)